MEKVQTPSDASIVEICRRDISEESRYYRCVCHGIPVSPLVLWRHHYLLFLFREEYLRPCPEALERRETAVNN